MIPQRIDEFADIGAQPWITALLAEITPDVPGTRSYRRVKFNTDTSFIPTINFSTPGNLSVVYTNQTCWTGRIGPLGFIALRVAFTPTYTTAAGSFIINGPFSGIAGMPFTPLSVSLVTNNVAWPVGTTHLIAQIGGNAEIAIISEGSGVNRIVWDVGEIPSGQPREFRISGWHFVT